MRGGTQGRRRAGAVGRGHGGATRRPGKCLSWKISINDKEEYQHPRIANPSDQIHLKDHNHLMELLR
jgi:hypothetical protein